MISKRGSAVWLVAVALAAVLVAPAAADPPNGQGDGGVKTVQVDCSKGKTIHNALQVAARELTIEISGICDEDVWIERSNVTLRGTDPTLDGIRGVKPGDVPGGVLNIRRADNIRIENLGIYDGLRDGLAADNVFGLFIENSRITGHARQGLRALGVIIVRVNNTEIESGTWAVSADGDVTCTNCTLHGGQAAWVGFQGQHNLFDSTATSDGFFGVWTQLSAALSVQRSSLSAAGIAAGTFGNAMMSLSDSTVDDGWLYCEEEGSLRLSNTQQASNSAGFNLFDIGCSVTLESGSEVLGFQIVDRFTEMTIDDTSLVDGDLNCDRAADAWCSNAATRVTGGSTCGQCQ